MRRKIAVIVVMFALLVTPTLVFAHGEEDHVDSYHIDVMQVMEGGFHGKLDGRVVEVVLSPDATLEKDGQSIKVGELGSGDIVFVEGVKMPGNKIGAKHVKVDKHAAAKHAEHSKHKDHAIEGHKMMGADDAENMKSKQQGH